ncbi:16S rRNA (guanine(966)-N(2))-methyltransferase RsmD [Herbiconiux ginsengi]|uniref:16S rRNA (Guanine966-N2)-methyltransferase n=1 Tax=Herbiconiux ginsengi TaxID=381665 RepID=A0A1H3S736_9MICO|nr:16S rRNA (guanine(966)-N(2))-methyltransferase RsmD [Herbiconiux ginsengi]SDZ33714.1 16S rRNA (guanine966-N2)-methyltransferase [Herbiconiux ginsengi]
MPRIIAGFAGSLSLAVPRSGTRPTSDRVREAIFSALEARGGLEGLRVLDLYAGSGALGLEAASRGAASVVLVEKNAAAARIARQNAEMVTKAAARDARPRVDVPVQAVLPYLRAVPVVVGAGYDVVFIDPPYELPEAELTETLTALVPLLAPDATVLVERSSRTPEPAWPAGLAHDRTKTYGETTLWWASPS